jgi:hypothetical protein
MEERPLTTPTFRPQPVSAFHTRAGNTSLSGHFHSHLRHFKYPVSSTFPLPRYTTLRKPAYPLHFFSFPETIPPAPSFPMYLTANLQLCALSRLSPYVFSSLTSKRVNLSSSLDAKPVLTSDIFLLYERKFWAFSLIPRNTTCS